MPPGPLCHTAPDWACRLPEELLGPLMKLSVHACTDASALVAGTATPSKDRQPAAVAAIKRFLMMFPFV